MPRKKKNTKGPGPQSLPMGVSAPSAQSGHSQTPRPQTSGRQSLPVGVSMPSAQTPRPQTSARQSMPLGLSMPQSVRAPSPWAQTSGRQSLPVGVSMPLARTTKPQTSEFFEKKTSSPEADSPREPSPNLEEEFYKKMRIRENFPSKPKPGRLGNRIRAISNLYPLQVPDGNIYHYDIEIYQNRNKSDSITTGEDAVSKKYRITNTAFNRKIFEKLCEHSSLKDNPVAYDGKKNIYSRNKILLPKEDILIDISDDDPNAKRKFCVVIKPVKKKDGGCAISMDALHAFYKGITQSFEMDAIMALETIMRHDACLKFTPVYRSFYYTSEKGSAKNLDYEKEVIFGYHQSIRLGQKGPLLNLDTSATTFYREQPLIDYIAHTLGTSQVVSRIAGREIRTINDKLKKLHIKVTHYRNYSRTFKKGISLSEYDTADKTTIENEQKETLTIAQYFRRKYNVELKYPNLPLICVTKEGGKKDFFPIEVCVVDSKHFQGKLSPKDTSEMIKFTNKEPRERFRKINEEVLGNADFENNTRLKSFGIKVSAKPLHVDARELHSPTLQYNSSSDETVVRPKNGSWNMIGKQLYKSAEIKQWVLLSFALVGRNNFVSLDRFAESMCKIARNQGLYLNRPFEINGKITFHATDEVKEDKIKRALMSAKAMHADLVVVILPDYSSRPNRNKIEDVVYKHVKSIAETELDLITQCIKKENLRSNKCNASFLSNICLKINSKLNGTNSLLTMGETPKILNSSDPVIVFGADVTHPGSNESDADSIAAVVASTDVTCANYSGKVCAQKQKSEKKKSLEVILDLEDMVKSLLDEFIQKNRKPSKVIFYRDGVSDGQVETVIPSEIEAIRRAFCRISPSWNPLLTFIVSQKRHHVRFRPEDQRKGVGRMGNLPPGTVVDTDVTLPKEFDFFLISQFGLQGTSRPTHYLVVEDDNKFSMDEMETLTYHLCYVFARCTKSISDPAPVRYADLLAYRAKIWIAENDSVLGPRRTFGNQKGTVLGYARTIKISESIKNNMFFV